MPARRSRMPWVSLLPTLLVFACGPNNAVDSDSSVADGSDLEASGQTPDSVSDPSPDAHAGNQPILFAISKAQLGNPVAQQQRGFDAVQSIAAAVEGAGTTSIHTIQEPVMDLEQYDENPVPFLVSIDIVKNELERYTSELGQDDTIIIYTHSHGLKGPRDGIGGLLLDPAGSEGNRPSLLDWAEYAQLLLELPAKTVVVLTMACYSGGLVDHLNRSAAAKALWQDRSKQGRSFVVISSQNAIAKSNPRRIEGLVVNPFTYAVEKAFSGAADGYQSDGAAAAPDGTITVGEFIEYVVDETRKHTRARDEENDPDPQYAGSYIAESALISRK